MQLLAHLFFPRHTNNYRAKLLQPSWLFVISLVVIALLITKLPARVSKILGYTASSLPVEKVVELTNKKRQEAGLAPLKFDQGLAQAAADKGQDMLAKDYWAHVSPSGTTPWVFFNKVGYIYRYAGENLARDFDSPEGVVDAWMSSPTHRDNLLSVKYEDIGIAVVEGDFGGAPTTLVVQHFGKRAIPSNLAQVPQGAGLNLPSPSPTTVQIAPPVLVPISGVTFGEQTFGGQVLSPFSMSRTIALGLIGMFLMLLVIDVLMLYQKGLVRITGRTLAHFSFFISIGIAILLIQKGIVL